jgi:hypothetical protein
MLPESVALDWTTGDSVAIEASQQISEGCDLSVLIEKDFECISRPDDPDAADTFPNPAKDESEE